MNKQYSKLISIIVPCFNSGRTIERTINSLKNQTWKQKEIIIVNDGSNDESTLNVLNSLKTIDALYIINQRNLGLSAARNVGANKARGEYLFFIDSDDWIEENSLELMYHFLKKNNKSSYVFTDIILEGNVRKIVRKNFNFFEQLFLNQIPYSIFISKKNWQKNKGYDEDMKLGYEDWEFNIRLGAKKIFGKRLPLPLFHYNVSNSGMLISKSSKYHSKIWHYIRSKNIELFKPSKILNYWIIWRKSNSNYPLLIFCFWYLILIIFPDRVTSYIFLLFRDSKWFFTRKIFNTNNQ